MWRFGRELRLQSGLWSGFSWSGEGKETRPLSSQQAEYTEQAGVLWACIPEDGGHIPLQDMCLLASAGAWEAGTGLSTAVSLVLLHANLVMPWQAFISAEELPPVLHSRISNHAKRLALIWVYNVSLYSIYTIFPEIYEPFAHKFQSWRHIWWAGTAVVIAFIITFTFATAFEEGV